MKKLGIEGLGAVWIKIFSLIQLVTGNVDVKNKGDLQTQINRLDQKIPSAANNGKLTIQKNGADIQSFTANQSGDATANIIVPNTTRSAAVTQEGQLALDAIEKNAAVPGTLAYDLAQTNSKLLSFNRIPLTLVAENLAGYGISSPAIDCMVYGHLCLINFIVGIKGGLGAWEVKCIATGAPIPLGVYVPYICNPAIAGGQGGEVTIEINDSGNLLAHGQEHGLSDNNWLEGTMIYLVP